MFKLLVQADQADQADQAGQNRVYLDLMQELSICNKDGYGIIAFAAKIDDPEVKTEHLKPGHVITFYYSKKYGNLYFIDP